MKEVTLYGGTIDSCLKNLGKMAAADESGEVLKAVFNDKYLLSTDTDDDAYLRITGKTKAEHDEEVRKWMEDYEAKRKAHEARIPELTEHYRKVARGVIIESELEYWDKIVPIRLGDLDDEFPCNAPTHEWAKVIGNIYDNPKLIKRH
ncbi:MAG: hypothetical protein IK144_11805 [Bacteroidaceae bacterium]|nr:hypothetical protein [Bacteroidaceae bacterium]